MTGSKKATRDYHQNLYSQHELFENGSWLEKNDELLLDIVKKNFANKDGVRILDIGSGVGRNAIPIAQVIAPNNGLVTCIDFLDIAIEKLKTNAKKYGVAGVIEAINQDLEDYSIESNHFDLIIGSSSLEHGVNSKEDFFEVIKLIQQGTKSGGINYLTITTNVEELNEQTLEPLRSDIGYSGSCIETISALKNIYKGWDLLYSYSVPYQERYIKKGQAVIWKNDFLIFITKK